MKKVESPNKGFCEFLRLHTPDFCWMTTEEIFLMTEQEFEHLELHVFRCSFSRLVKEGLFHVKENNRNEPSKGGKPPKLYMRKEYADVKRGRKEPRSRRLRAA